MNALVCLVFTALLAQAPEGAPELRCAEEGICLAVDAPSALGGACRAGDEEVRFDVYAHAHDAPPPALAELRWPDWCGRLVDQRGATLVAVYGSEACLDDWHPGWRHGRALDAPRPAGRSELMNNPVLLDCLGKLMDDAARHATEPPWVVLHALAHATVLASIGG